ncbi:MAG: hypothetical protein H7Z41_16500, partial [Cytophagales bacterium]|nr:hypothetical protein [Armatimonadota bacterium]
ATSAEFQNKKLVRTDLQVRDLRARGRVLWEDSVPSKNNEDWLGPLVFSSDGATVMTHTTRSDVVESTVYGESTKEMSARIMSWDSRTGKPSLKTPYFGRQSFFRAALAPPLNSLVTWRGNLVKAEGGQTVTSSTLQVWDAQTGTLQRTLEAPDADITAVAVSDDGRRIVAAGSALQRTFLRGTIVLIWDAESGRLLRTLRDRKGTILNTVAVSSLGTRVAVGGQDKTIALWDATTGRQQAELVGHGSQVMKAAFSPDGSRLATGDLRGIVKVWRVP